MKKLLDNKIFKFIYGIIKFVVVAILVLYVLFLAIQRFGGNQSIAGYRVFTVATGSMVPVYNVNDVILVHDIDFKDLKVGDDITYKGEVSDFAGKIVTHRIISIDESNETLITRGVANDADDPSIKASQIYGKVSGKLLVFSFLTNLTKNKIGFYFLIFVPLVIVIFLEIADFVTTARNDGDEDDEESK